MPQLSISQPSSQHGDASSSKPSLPTADHGGSGSLGGGDSSKHCLEACAATLYHPTLIPTGLHPHLSEDACTVTLTLRSSYMRLYPQNPNPHCPHQITGPVAASLAATAASTASRHVHQLSREDRSQAMLG